MGRLSQLYGSGFKGGVASVVTGRAKSGLRGTPWGGAEGAGGLGGRDAEGPRREVNMSTAIRPTPTQMAMSATLKVGQWSVTTQPLWTFETRRFIDSIHLAW